MTMIDQLIDFDYLLMRRMDASTKEQQEMREMHQLVQVLLAIFASEEGQSEEAQELSINTEQACEVAEQLTGVAPAA
ncbi:MAG: hypothetical protein ACR2PH_10940 [Desulfobulbia bacterium]